MTNCPQQRSVMHRIIRNEDTTHNTENSRPQFWLTSNTLRFGYTAVKAVKGLVIKLTHENMIV